MSKTSHHTCVHGVKMLKRPHLKCVRTYFSSIFDFAARTKKVFPQPQRLIGDLSRSLAPFVTYLKEIVQVISKEEVVVPYF